VVTASVHASGHTRARSVLHFPLAGPAGEPVDLWRTLVSHGVADLPPSNVDEELRRLVTTVPLSGQRPRTLLVSEAGGGRARVEVLGPPLGAPGRRRVTDLLRVMLNLDEDLSGFYEAASRDPELAWVTRGAGRMLRSPTVFEDVVKTICTTNCAWSGTVRMVTGLVEQLGEQSAGGHGRAFPTPAAMAAASDAFYRDVARAGYRGPYLRTIALGVAERDIDLELLRSAAPEDLPDDEVATRLLALPGIGPYAAAHVMMLLGRHSRLVLDSWTRPKWARVNGRRAKDTTIERRFRRYGRFAGLAFWLRLTEDWA
jgi:3-methyladenine DNA glycosylase/8-oxoguanine DNA glycosylase